MLVFFSCVCVCVCVEGRVKGCIFRCVGRYLFCDGLVFFGDDGCGGGRSVFVWGEGVYFSVQVG